jgi:hypothetical protein
MANPSGAIYIYRMLHLAWRFFSWTLLPLSLRDLSVGQELYDDVLGGKAE